MFGFFFSLWAGGCFMRYSTENLGSERIQERGKLQLSFLCLYSLTPALVGTSNGDK